MTQARVTLTENGKRTLDQLHARLALLGYRVSKGRILESCLELASESIGNVVARLKGARDPVPGWEELLREAVASAEDWGPTSWRDIDRLVYGARLARDGSHRRGD